ncbi:MAG: hypothetical protein RJA04_175, partial [Bacteroidota bacterium]
MAQGYFINLQMRNKVFIAFMILLALPNYAQQFTWENQEYKAINSIAKVVEMDGVKVLEVTRDLVKSPFDINNIENSVDGPTFVKLANADIENGTIEVKMLSKIQSDSPFPQARGFIGLAYRIDDANTMFENIYLRPSNGRADDQLRRNHTIQYFAYPGYTFSRLRKESNGLYETYADI